VQEKLKRKTLQFYLINLEKSNFKKNIFNKPTVKLIFSFFEHSKNLTTFNDNPRATDRPDQTKKIVFMRGP